MNSKIKAINLLCETELEKLEKEKASWHREYKDSAYIYIGGLNYKMNEGDLAIVFSQFGEITDVHMVRDMDTGKSQGFAFICYEDQKSTILAVDNMNGTMMCGRPVCVDHVKEYKVPKAKRKVKVGENSEDEDNQEDQMYKPSGPDGKLWGDFRILTDEDKVLMGSLEEKERRQKKVEELRLKELVEQDNQPRKKAKLVYNTSSTADQDAAWEQMFQKQLRKDKKTREKDDLKQLKSEVKKIRKTLKKDKKEKKGKDGQ